MKFIIIKIIVIIAALISITTVARSATLEPFKVEYTLKGGGLSIGKAISELRDLGNGRYIYERTAKAQGLAKFFVSEKITERSEWQLINGHPRPDQFTYTEIDGAKKKLESVTFNWETGKAITTRKGKTKTLDLQEGTLDRLSMEIRIMIDIANNQKTMVYPIVDKDRLKTREFVLEGTEDIKTPAGFFKVLKYKVKRSDSKKSTLFWLAKKLNYLPVKIEHRDKKGGFALEFQLNRVLLPKSLATQNPAKSRTFLSVDD